MEHSLKRIRWLSTSADEHADLAGTHAEPSKMPAV
jgi:hypothetical protein